MAASNLQNVTPITATNTGNRTTSDMTNVAIDTSTHPVSPSSSSATSYNSANFKIGCDNTNSGRNWLISTLNCVIAGEVTHLDEVEDVSLDFTSLTILNCEKNDKITSNCLHSLQRLKIQVYSKSIKNVSSIFAPRQAQIYVPCLIFLCLITLSKSTKLIDLDCKPCDTSIYEHSILLIDDNVVSQGEG